MNPPRIGMPILDWQTDKGRPQVVETEVVGIIGAIVSLVPQSPFRVIICPESVGLGPGHRIY